MQRSLQFIVTAACLLALAAPAAAVCGDGITDAGEQCDLGLTNCDPGLCCDSSCDSSCTLIGRCTGTRGCCSTDADCPVGEGCCGNRVVETAEVCDDGNRINGDCCSTSCQVEAAPCVPLPHDCAALGPLNVLGNPSIRRMVMRDSRPVDGQYALTARDRFVLPDGLEIDPDSEIVSFILTENDGANDSHELYRGTLDPARCPGGRCFAARTNAAGLDKKWEFRSGLTPVTGAPGWKRARLTRNLGFPSQIAESYKLDGSALELPIQVDGRRRLRSSIVLGDVCVTRLLDCERNNTNTRLTCREIHCGDGLRNRGEQCGETGLSCRGRNKICDSCRCVRRLP